MSRPRADGSGVAILLAAGALALCHEAVAWAFAARLPGVGFPLLSLLLRAAQLLLAATGLFRLRALLSAAGAWALGGLDAAELRLQKLPPRRGGAIRAVALCLTVGGAIVLFFEGAQLGGELETRAFDLFLRLRFPERSQAELATGRELPSARRQEDVVMLAVDDETIAHLGWPIPRLYYSRLIDAVAAAKPASLSFDVALVDPNRDHPEWDVELGAAARRAGNVTFAFTVARLTGDSRRAPSEAASHALGANTIPWHDSAAGLPEYSELVGGDAAPQPVIDPVANNVRAIAMANVVLDGSDDVLRHSLLVARLRQQLLPSLSLRQAALALDVPLAAIAIFPGSHLDLGGKRRIPIDRMGRTLVRYQGRHDSRGQGPFRYFSVWSLIRADWTVTLTGNLLGEDQRFIIDDQTRVTSNGVPVSPAQLDAALLHPGAAIAGKARYAPDPGRILELELGTGRPAPSEPDFEMLDEETLRFSSTIATAKSNHADASALAGKHVFVGSTALAAADLRNSPLGEIPGVEHHATMLANLLHDDFFHESPPWVNALIVVGASLAAAIIGVGFSAGSGLLVSALLTLALLTGGFVLASSGVHVPIIGPSVAVGLTYLLAVILGARAERNAHARSEQQREFVRHTFGRYLSEQVVESLLDSPDGLRLGGQRSFVTIMMTDLRGFTSMCGSMEPEDVVRLLNNYLEVMTRIITRYGGTIDEFIGDAILVVFGAPLPLDQAELRAVACAIEMLNAMPQVNGWNAEHKLPDVEMGIGVHSGEVVLGNIGSELRAKYGIVGSTINLTSRVESYTVGGQVLISEATRERCGESLTLGTTQVVSPKGVKGTLTIHDALAVGAPYDVRLRQANEHLVAPSVPIALRYGTIKQKQVGDLSHLARVEALSELGMELRVDEDLPVLSDLQLRIVDGEGLRPGELYGKVLRANVRPQVIYLRLTSVPPEVRPLLEAARGVGTRPEAAAMEPTLVST